jgi:hypothetical protein
VRFAEPLLQQYSTTMVWPYIIKIPKVDNENAVYDMPTNSNVDWVRIYPAASFEEVRTLQTSNELANPPYSGCQGFRLRPEMNQSECKAT